MMHGYRLIVSRSATLPHHSFGRVETIADLYDPKIFGPNRDGACECGKYAGETAEEGLICDRCGVKVSSASRKLRRLRQGHIELACPCLHPIGHEHTINNFPIAPVGFRRDEGGGITPLGRSYEQLVEANVQARSQIPDRHDRAYYEALRSFDAEALQHALDTVVGTDPPAGQHREGTLLHLLSKAIATGDESVAVLLRCAGYALHLEGEV